MKQHFATLCATALALAFAVPAQAGSAPDLTFAKVGQPDLTLSDEIARKGRKKPRIPGGSGCDDPRDILEHPECAG